jgi:predicted acetylornithine/succinylornithine family transaminase
MRNYPRNPVRFVRGEGSWLIDDEGRRYLDAFAGVAVSALGHAHPALVDAVSKQVATLAHVSNHYEIPGQEELASRLVKASFDGQVLFVNTGTEAVEAAIKLARLWGNVVHGGAKHRLVAFDDGFHGRTLGALAVTANPAYREPFAPLAPADFLPFGDADALSALSDDVAAVIIEPVQGEGGLSSCPPGYLERLREICDRTGALLILDEIQTGIGRTGAMFGYQHDGITPDIVTVAKGLGGGVPIGAVVARPAIAELLKPGLHGTTFGGNPLACAAALAVLGVVEAKGFLDQVRQRGEELGAGLARLFPGREPLGRGLLRGVRLGEPVGGFVTRAREAGLIVGPSGHDTLRIAPPLTISVEELSVLLELLATVRQ